MPDLPRIVLDQNIADFEVYLKHLGRLVPLSASEISNQSVQDVDVLLVRSVTRVNESLLHGSRVRFVGSATAGTDHIDLAYLEKNGITFRSAPGSNAESVAEYVVASLLRLAAITEQPLSAMSLGVVGRGQTGGRVAERAKALGLTVFACDPPLADAGVEGLVDLEKTLACDIVSLHVPLTSVGAYPTFHLIDAVALDKLRPQAWLINASRGAVVDNVALLRRLEADDRLRVVLDVWEGEPVPNETLIERVTYGSPHVAGYSYDGKVAGTKMIAAALGSWLSRDTGGTRTVETAAPETGVPYESSLRLSVAGTFATEAAFLDQLVSQMFDVSVDDAAMRLLALLPGEDRGRQFVRLRRSYRRRRSFRAYWIDEQTIPEQQFSGVTQRIRDALRCAVL